MNDQERDLELLDGFLSDLLSDAEMDKVRTRLEVEPALRVIKDELLQLKSGIEAAGKKNLMEKMNRWDSNVNPLISEKGTELGNVIPWRAYIGWAALLVVGFFSIFSWYTSDGQKAKRLYGSYFKVYDNIMVPTQRDMSDEGLKQRAFYHYDLREYQEARPLFEQLLTVDNGEYIRFYYGIVLMALEDREKAESVLSSVDSDFTLQANWYRALNAIRQKDFLKAKELLRKLEEGESSYSNNAKEILKKLD